VDISTFLPHYPLMKLQKKNSARRMARFPSIFHEIVPQQHRGDG